MQANMFLFYAGYMYDIFPILTDIWQGINNSSCEYAGG